MKLSPIPETVSSPAVSQSGPARAVPSSLAVEYSAHASGKTWSAQIESFAGGYEASVPNLPQAAAAGQTVAQVEDDLGHLIDFFA